MHNNFSIFTVSEFMLLFISGICGICIYKVSTSCVYFFDLEHGLSGKSSFIACFFLTVFFFQMEIPPANVNEVFPLTSARVSLVLVEGS